MLRFMSMAVWLFKSEKKIRTEKRVSGPVFTCLCIFHFMNAEGNLETSPSSFTDSITVLLTEQQNCFWHVLGNTK